MDDVATSESGHTADLLHVDDSTTDSVDMDTSTVDLHELQIQYDGLRRGDVDVENAISTDVLQTINCKIKDEGTPLKIYELLDPGSSTWAWLTLCVKSSNQSTQVIANCT
jgi:hypothetical protein